MDVGGCEELAAAAGARIHVGPDDKVPGAEPVLNGMVIEVGELAVECLWTPGHSPGHTCYLCGDYLITGDLLFCGKVGGTGDFFPGSSARLRRAITCWASCGSRPTSGPTNPCSATIVCIRT